MAALSTTTTIRKEEVVISRYLCNGIFIRQMYQRANVHGKPYDENVKHDGKYNYVISARYGLMYQS
jgi:hypothetical protein